MKKSFSDIPLIMGAIVSIFSCFISGCAPTLDKYVKTNFKGLSLPAVSRCPKPLLPMTLAVTDFRDDRPGSEKVNVGNAVFDGIFIPLSWGLIAAWYRVDETDRPQPFTRVDKDVPDYIAETLRSSNLFSSVTRISGGPELYSKPSQVAAWRKTHTEELVLIGSIQHLWGKWSTGSLLSESHSKDWQFEYTSREYQLLGAGGNISLSLKLIRASNGDVYWEHDFDVYEPHVGDLNVDMYTSDQTEQNVLAATAFCKSLGMVTEELRLYLETHPMNIETTSK